MMDAFDSFGDGNKEARLGELGLISTLANNRIDINK